MELFRALAVLTEAPSDATARVAVALELGALPTADEYTELFSFQLYPYASVYVGAEGMLGGEARDRISGFWRALGQTPPAESDHLAVMLALYARLCELAEGEGEPLRRANWVQARKAFLWEHLLSWVPVYLHKLADIAAPFYRRWGELLLKALLDESLVVGQLERLPLHLRAAPALVDPRVSNDVNGFLAALLSPVRCGMILTRADLSRAAQALHLGTRLGERAFILRALFGQNTSGMLEWLAEEADVWTQRHQSDREALGEVAQAWEEKARAAAKMLRQLKQETTEAPTIAVTEN